MKNLLYLFPLLLLFSCSKEQVVENIPTSTISDADIVYHYKGKTYPIKSDKETGEVIKDKNYEDYIAALGTNGGSVAFTIVGHGSPKDDYIFDSEFEGYDYIEKNIDALIGRRQKLALRIEQLRERLIAQYGETINYNDRDTYGQILEEVKKIYTELHVTKDLPHDLELFVGIKAEQFSAARNPVLTVAQHNGMNGHQLVVENGYNTTIWTYGDFGCFQMAANPDLTQEPMNTAQSWNDQISSQYFNYIVGADAMGIGYYQNSNYSTGGCQYRVIEHVGGPQFGLANPFNMGNFNFEGGAIGGPNFCPNMDNQISSIKIKAIWQGCYSGQSDFSDLY